MSVPCRSDLQKELRRESLCTLSALVGFVKGFGTWVKNLHGSVLRKGENVENGKVGGEIKKIKKIKK